MSVLAISGYVPAPLVVCRTVYLTLIPTPHIQFLWSSQCKSSNIISIFAPVPWSQITFQATMTKCPLCGDFKLCTCNTLSQHVIISHHLGIPWGSTHRRIFHQATFHSSPWIIMTVHATHKVTLLLLHRHCCNCGLCVKLWEEFCLIMITKVSKSIKVNNAINH